MDDQQRRMPIAAGRVVPVWMNERSMFLFNPQNRLRLLTQRVTAHSIYRASTFFTLACMLDFQVRLEAEVICCFCRHSSCRSGWSWSVSWATCGRRLSGGSLQRQVCGNTQA